MSAADASNGEAFGDLFDPRHIVVVGASDDPDNIGARFVRGLQRARFPGRISVVHPRAQQVSGLPTYGDLKACPVPVDHVVVAVSRERVAPVLADAVAVGARSVHVFSGGFAEDVDLRGHELQAALIRLVRGTPTRLIGPNCMGMHHPARGITFRDDLPVEAGPLGIVSQSGGVSIAAIRLASRIGIGTSLAFSYGNGADFGLVDAVRHLANDGETRAIAVYLESANDPGLGDALEKALACKPVVVWPGGTSPRSAWAARRHTGAPGGLLRAEDLPSGCIVVDRLEDFVQVPAALCVAATLPGPRIAFASISGGTCVVFAAMCERERLPLASLAAATRDKLAAIYRMPSAILDSPIDLGGPGFLSRGRLRPLFQMLAADADVDTIVFHLAWDYVREVDGRMPGYSDSYLEAVIQAATSATVPVLVYFPAVDDDPTDPPARRRLWAAGIPVFEPAEQIARFIRSTTATRPSGG